MADISQKWLHACSFLVPFTGNYASEIHVSGIAQLLSLPQRTVARQLQILEKAQFLQYRKKGKNKYYFLNLNVSYSLGLLQIVESFKELQFKLKYPEVSHLIGELSALTPIVLFGSYAKNSAKKDSDVDLVIFSRKRTMLAEIMSKYPFEVHAHYVTFDLFEKRLKEKQPLALEITKDHIFFGEKDRIIKILKRHFQK